MINPRLSIFDVICASCSFLCSSRLYCHIMGCLEWHHYVEPPFAKAKLQLPPCSFQQALSFSVRCPALAHIIRALPDLWQRVLDSNQRYGSQNPVSCRLTNPLCEPLLTASGEQLFSGRAFTTRPLISVAVNQVIYESVNTWNTDSGGRWRIRTPRRPSLTSKSVFWTAVLPLH